MVAKSHTWKKWTDKELAQLRESWYQYPKILSKEDLEERFGRSIDAIREKARSKNFKSCAKWSEIEIDYVRKYYSKKSIKELANDLNRTPKGVDGIIHRTGMRREKTKCNAWTPEQDAMLKRMYLANYRRKAIAFKMNRTDGSVAMRLHQLRKRGELDAKKV